MGSKTSAHLDVINTFANAIAINDRAFLWIDPIGRFSNGGSRRKVAKSSQDDIGSSEYETNATKMSRRSLSDILTRARNSKLRKDEGNESSIRSDERPRFTRDITGEKDATPTAGSYSKNLLVLSPSLNSVLHDDSEEYVDWERELSSNQQFVPPMYVYFMQALLVAVKTLQNQANQRMS